MCNQTSNKGIISSQTIKDIARNIGFDFCGIAPAGKLLKDRQYFSKWLSMGCQGKMSYLEKNLDLRFDTSELVEGAKSVISLAINYYPQKAQNSQSRYKISKYAYGKDYHLVLKNKLSLLFEQIKKENGSITGRGFVDSAPVMEKRWAQKAGLGWEGKNGCLIIPKHGSFFFLCELIVDVEFDYDIPLEKNYCGNCTKCIDSCPTQAINKEGFVNAKKCISYLTIELKDNISDNPNNPKFDNWIFGCDICQDVCPWNRFARPANKNTFLLNEAVLDFDGSHWENLTKEQYSSFIKKTNSPISRIKYDKLKSNIEFVR